MKKLHRLTFFRPSDFHTHIRSPAQVGERCFRFLVRMNCTHYRYVVIEPNAYLKKSDPKRHIETVDDLVKYRKLVLSVLGSEPHASVPRFLIKLTPKTTPGMIRDAAAAGCIGAKLYPEGVTSGSHVGGVSDFYSRSLYSCLETLQELRLAFQIHPEMPHTFCLEREHLFHRVLKRYVRDFKELRIFVEHITDRRTLSLVEGLYQMGYPISGTITGHHLELTLDNVLGRNENHCWPCAKYPEDRSELREAATSGIRNIISITDSAPWKWAAKHPTRVVPPMNGCACAGVFNPAKIAILRLVEIFEASGKLDRLPCFWANNGLDAYRLGQAPNDEITVVEAPWQVPLRYDSGSGTITPFLAGSTLKYQIES